MYNKIEKTKGFISKHASYFILVTLILLVGIINPQFFSVRVLRDLLTQSSIKLLMALGMMFVLISGNCDLSAGRIVGLSAVVAGSLAQSSAYFRRFFPSLPELPVIIPVMICLMIGCIAAFLNGFIITKFGVDSFIATLGTQLVIYGFTSIYYDLEPNESQPIGGLTEAFSKLGTGMVLGVPILLIIAVFATVICYIILKYHRFGKKVYSVGGNKDASVIAGIDSKKIIIAAFVIEGLLAGLSGCLEAARTGGATNSYGVNYEFDAMCACIVGGVSLNGGVGNVSGVIAGVLIFQLIQYGMTFIGINPYWQNVIKGLIVIIAVAIDMRKYLKRR